VKITANLLLRIRLKGGDWVERPIPEADWYSHVRKEVNRLFPSKPARLLLEPGTTPRVWRRGEVWSLRNETLAEVEVLTNSVVNPDKDAECSGGRKGRRNR